MRIPFNIPYITGQEARYMNDALKSRFHCGNGEYSKKCIHLMKKNYGFADVFLTPSCTLALEMGALLAGIGPGDEVIMPSYTFSSTANAVIRTGAIPVFCEITPDTMNLDVNQLSKLVTRKTKMIIPIDYAGIPCDIESIMKIAKKNNLIVMVDSAQSFHSYYKDKPAAILPDLAAFSFHETKNISCGEGGALVVNRREWIKRANFLQEKGTDRKLVLDGIKNKYHWVDIGSSFLLSDILAAMLLAQLENTEKIVKLRSKITLEYNKLLKPFADSGHIMIPNPPKNVTINHHAYFVIFDSKKNRKIFLKKLNEKNIFPYIGYLPLHSSPMGKKYGYSPGDLPITQELASRIVRLPFYTDLANTNLNICVEEMRNALNSIYEI